jgi:hypothetical protein
MMFLASKASPALQSVIRAFEAQGDVVQGGPINFSTKCPCHEGEKLSLSICDGDEGVMLNCHAGCDRDEMFNAVVAHTGLKRKAFFYQQKGSAADAGPVVTIAELAAAKNLPVEIFIWAGMRDSAKGILIPYEDGLGPPRVRVRCALKAKDGSYWQPAPYVGHRITAFGAWRLPEFRPGGTVYLVEGGSWVTESPALIPKRRCPSSSNAASLGLGGQPDSNRRRRGSLGCLQRRGLGRGTS